LQKKEAKRNEDCQGERHPFKKNARARTSKMDLQLGGTPTQVDRKVRNWPKNKSLNIVSKEEKFGNGTRAKGHAPKED